MSIRPTSAEVAFLGIAERASAVREGNSNLLKWHVIGLKNILPFFCYPTIVNGLNFVFAVRGFLYDQEVRINIRCETGEQIGFFNIGLSLNQTNPPAPPLTNISNERVFFATPAAWTPVALQFNAPRPLIFFRPGRYSLYQQGSADDDETLIGAFYCATFDPPPLTAERIAAIKSDPRAAKAVRILMKCNVCAGELLAYAALEHNAALEAEGAVWYADLPDSYLCSCGNLNIDLKIARKNMFGFLGKSYATDQSLVNFIPLYERSTLENLRKEFVHVLNSNPKEEKMQKFIEDNPILLRQFPATRILFKPPILTRYFADFAIVSPQRELILIEIEPPGINLLRKNGDHAAPLTHAVNQVQNWMQIASEHRNTFLTELKIEMTAVGSIRGVVIAGRDTPYDPAHLRQLKAVYSGSIIILTYDDLLGSLVALIEQISRL